MEKRSAARELAFLAIFQLPKNPEKLAKIDLQAICLSAVRTLADNSRSNIKKAETFFLQAERALMSHKMDHPENEMLTEDLRSVPLPQTDEFLDHINNCYHALSLMREGLQIPEIYWHFHDKEIEEFTLDLIFKFTRHKEEINHQLEELSKSWDFSRIRKLDKTILQLATTEILHCDTPNNIVSAEAVKLANKYSTEEGVKFTNGILADLLEKLS